MQPIELCWAFCKNYVASKYFSGRTIEQTKNTLLDRFSGNKEQSGYTAKVALSHIEHCHAWCNKYIEDDSMLTGTIDNLQALGSQTELSTSPERNSSLFAHVSSSSSSRSGQTVCSPSSVGSVSLLSSPIMGAASSSGQRMRPSALSRALSSRTLDFTGRAERSDQEIEEDEYFEDDSPDFDDIYFGDVQLSDDEDDDFDDE